MNLKIEVLHEPELNRWWGHIDAMGTSSGVAVFGNTREDAIKNVKIAALQALVWMLQDGDISDVDAVFFKVKEKAIAA